MSSMPRQVSLRTRCVDPLDLVLAIDADFPASPDQKQRQSLGEGFKAAMGRGYAACSQDQNGRRLWFHGRWHFQMHLHQLSLNF